LELALKQLRDRLESQGLFSVERKRPLPMFPKRVAVVTSPQAAALRDFLEVAGRRWRSTEIVLVPSLVQGDQAPRELIAGLQKAASLRPDVIALVRGGGSLEDLWAFNNEALAHAIFVSPIPVVVGVGHETDVTIADLVADVRALTPSQAAELIFPDRHAFQLQLAQIRKRLTQACVNIVARAWQRWQWAARTHSIREPLRHVQVYSQRLDELERRMVHSILRTVETSDRKLKSSSKELDALNPRRVLERGYAWVTAPSTGRVVTHSDQVQQGDVVLIHLFQGELRAEVQDVQEKSW
jgi:exodeoxyribonuclease VII large subunit